MVQVPDLTADCPLAEGRETHETLRSHISRQKGSRLLGPAENPPGHSHSSADPDPGAAKEGIVRCRIEGLDHLLGVPPLQAKGGRTREAGQGSARMNDMRVCSQPEVAKSQLLLQSTAECRVERNLRGEGTPRIQISLEDRQRVRKRAGNTGSIEECGGKNLRVTDLKVSEACS